MNASRGPRQIHQLLECLPRDTGPSTTRNQANEPVPLGAEVVVAELGVVFQGLVAQVIVVSAQHSEVKFFPVEVMDQ